MPHELSEVLTPAEVAALLKVHTRTILRLAKAGGIPAARVGGRWRFRKEHILAWLDAQAKGKPSQAK